MKYTFTILSFYILILGKSYAQTLPDSNFIKCLRSRHPSTVQNGQIIPSEAAKLQGTLACPSRGITSMEGIQLFTGINSIQFQKNNISYIPDISALRRLQHFDVSENDLDHLPDFSKLGSLQAIHATRNHIKTLPDLSKNDSLEILFLHNNDIDTLPNLSNLKRLRIVHLAYNNLRYLPNIEKLTSLEVLGCWKNQIESLPSLVNLTKLSYLDASYNNLSEAPILGIKANLDTVYLNNNNITKLVDFSQCTNLKNVRLYLNPLTFKELIKLTNVVGYETLFKLNPKLTSRIGKTISILESEPFVLSTNIDRGVSNVSYNWYKNGTFYKTVTNDSLLFSKVSLSDSGSYACHITHPSFKGYSIPTDSFKITVKSCIELKDVIISTTDITCLNSGTVTVTSKTLSTNTTFELHSASGKSIYSHNGKFTDLVESEYKLKITTSNGCSKDYTWSILIDKKECDEVLISPDNDGNADSHYFEDTGKVIIYDKRGTIIKAFNIPAEWNGDSDKGKVFSGFYVADINNGKKLLGITVLY